MTNPLFESLLTAQQAVNSISEKHANSQEAKDVKRTRAIEGLAEAVLPLFENGNVAPIKGDYNSLLNRYIIHHPVLKPFLRLLFPKADNFYSTRLYAKCNTGLGHHLYIRGNAPGLSWDKGVQMECISGDVWTWATREKNFEYKILFDDDAEKGWEDGESNRYKKGKKNEIILPTFSHFNKGKDNFSEEVEALNKMYAAQAAAEKGCALGRDASQEDLIKMIKKVMYALVPEGLELFDENQPAQSYALQCILKYPYSSPFLFQIFPLLPIECIPDLHPENPIDPCKLGAFLGKLWELKRIPRNSISLKACFSKMDTVYAKDQEKRKLAFQTLIKSIIESDCIWILKNYLKSPNAPSRDFISLEFAKILAARKVTPILNINECRNQIKSYRDLLEIFLIALSQSEFSVPALRDYSLPGGSYPQLIKACNLLYDNAPIEEIFEQLKNLCAEKKWKDVDSLLNETLAIKCSADQRRAVICLIHFLGRCVLDKITPKQFALILKLKVIQKLRSLPAKAWLTAVQAFFASLNTSFLDAPPKCISSAMIPALTARLVAHGLSPQIALEIQQAMSSKPSEASLQLIHFLSEWIDCPPLRDENAMNVTGKHLVAILSNSESLGTTLEILTDAIVLFEKEAFLACIQSGKDLPSIFLNQLQFFLKSKDVEHFKRIYEDTLNHTVEKKRLISHLKKLVQLPKKERTTAIENLGILFTAHAEDLSHRPKRPQDLLDPQIVQITSEIFHALGFAKEEMRDRDHEHRDNESVSEVQGTSTFCKTVAELSSKNPTILSSEYLRNYNRLDPTCLTLRHKRMGHVFSLEGKIHLIDGTTRSLEGSNETFFLPMLKTLFEAFASKHPDLVSDSLRVSMSNAFSKAVWNDTVSDEKIAEIHQLIHDPNHTDSIIVGSGWDWHSTQLVFRRIKGKLYLCCCNRGSDHKNKPGICIFSIDKEKEKSITPEFLKRVASRMNFTEKNYTSREKIQEELEATEVCYLPMKAQKVGNCVYTSLKAVFLAILFLEESQKDSDSLFTPSAQERAKKIYKDLLRFDDRMILEDFLIEMEKITPTQMLSEEYQPYLKGLKQLTDGVQKWLISEIKSCQTETEKEQLYYAVRAIHRFKQRLMQQGLILHQFKR